MLAARVMIKDMTLNVVTINPFMNPSSAEASMAIVRQPAKGMPSMASFAATTPPKLAMVPMDRSNSSTHIISVAHSAQMANRDICREILMKFAKVAKVFGRSAVKIRMITASARIVPYVRRKSFSLL